MIVRDRSAIIRVIILPARLHILYNLVQVEIMKLRRGSLCHGVHAHFAFRNIEEFHDSFLPLVIKH